MTTPCKDESSLLPGVAAAAAAAEEEALEAARRPNLDTDFSTLPGCRLLLMLLMLFRLLFMLVMLVMLVVLRAAGMALALALALAALGTPSSLAAAGGGRFGQEASDAAPVERVADAHSQSGSSPGLLMTALE